MRWTLGICCGLSVACLFGSQANVLEPGAGERLLTNYANDDGTKPDGRVSDRDDSSALQRALNAGPGIVRIGPGTYRLHDVTIPDQVTLVGAGPATVLQASQNRPVFLQQKGQGWRLRDVALHGEAADKWQERTDQNAHGILVADCWGYEISGVTVSDFHGAGLQISRTNNLAAGFTDGGLLTRITALQNFIGIRFDTRAEYITATHLHCHHNLTGLMIHAGNCNIASSNIGENIDGVVIVDHENGSHGSLTGCLVNHNQRYALWARHVENGMAISNCCIFYGTIRLENCRGVNMTSGLISASIHTEGPDFNRISGNHIIPLTFSFLITPTTLFEGNFTKEGPWQP